MKMTEWNEEKVEEYVKAGWTLTYDKRNDNYKLMKKVKGKLRQFNLPRELNDFCCELRRRKREKQRNEHRNGLKAKGAEDTRRYREKGSKAQSSQAERQKCSIELSAETFELLKEYAELEGLDLEKAAEAAILRDLNDGETFILGKGVDPYVQLIFKALKEGRKTQKAITEWLLEKGFIKNEYSAWIGEKLKELENDGYIEIRGLIRKEIILKKEPTTNGKVIVEKEKPLRMQAILKLLRKRSSVPLEDLIDYLAKDYGWASEEEARKLIHKLEQEGLLEIIDGTVLITN